MSPEQTIKADLHIHSVASGHAYSTVLENLAAAEAAGLTLVGITDHGPALPAGAHPYHFWNLRVIPEEIAGIRILRGIEANIVDGDGRLDLDDEYLAALDIVMAALHPVTGYSGDGVEENTQAYINAMKNPHVQVIAHPHSAQHPVDVEKLVAAAVEHGVLLELNNSSLRGSREGSVTHLRELAAAMKKADMDILLGSDAHIAFDVGRLDEVLAVCGELDISPYKVLNFYPKRLLKALQSRRS